VFIEFDGFGDLPGLLFVTGGEGELWGFFFGQDGFAGFASFGVLMVFVGAQHYS